MKRTRVLVVEDSLTVRHRLLEILQADAQLEVVGAAEDGKQAIEQCLALRPDIMTLDMMLPLMTGLAVTEYVMAHCPTPILIVSASFNRGELYRTYDALAAGAVEAIEKPGLQDADDQWAQEFVAMVKLVARVKAITHLRGRLTSMPADPLRTGPTPTKSTGPGISLVAIGASTGGPGALVEILRALPVSRTPILIVIHIGEPFGAGFAEWLDGQTPHSVRFPRDGELLTPQVVLLAPPGLHLVVRNQRVWLADTPERHSCRPSVDVLFESIAAHYKGRILACLLTGMGQDGARGLLAIRQAGGFTIAQDEASSVVYGMPHQAALLGAAAQILPLGEIGPSIAAQITAQQR
ncbi:two-component system chemotaxis response regulator CheB [Silvimonas terrae]|uniref:Protein-glutamate methylesterase/protein-glutamine glutaminase n=1 Tax=Silvimonas terrae TaxID=300266 RepID=A0A840RCQ8_9NEIS|nr:chemotaxis-specific protein-glutamate methyltransferase CheB [Silvimonas terrae]MBB5190747.1 two-component system chemotaxis response regulator CheB [Silvimonas terrae]